MPVRLGLRENLGQVSLLVLVNAFFGAMVGLERSILLAIAEHEFQIAARTAILSFIVSPDPKQRGLAMGHNEFAGCVAVAGSAWATGWIAARYGLRPQPLALGIVYVGAGLLLSWLALRETRHHVVHEASTVQASAGEAAPTQRVIFRRTSLTDRNLSSVSQAGLVNNLNDGMACGLFPLLFLGQIDRRRRPSDAARVGRRVYRLWRDLGYAVGGLLAGASRPMPWG